MSHAGETARDKDARPESWLEKLTRAADDDPSGIATYSQAGAQFGFIVLAEYPISSAIHGFEISSHSSETPLRDSKSFRRATHPKSS